MNLVILTRHAHAASNATDVVSCLPPGEGLSELGREQSLALHHTLVREPIALGVSTELLRTKETLEIALGGRDVPTLVLPDLNEIHFGSFDGGLLAAYREWAGAETPALPAPGGGESRTQAAARYASGLRLVLARPEETALVIGHALAVRYIVDAADGLVPASLMLAPVEHALPYRLEAGELETAAELLESWTLDPRFRDPA